MRGRQPAEIVEAAEGPGRVALDMRLCLSAAFAARQAARHAHQTIERTHVRFGAVARVVATQMKEAMKGGDKVRVGACVSSWPR